MAHEYALPLKDAGPRTYGAMARFAETAAGEAKAAGVPAALLELIKLRASIENGCTFCVALHRRDALALGEQPERVDAVADWENSDRFDDAERAALALTDAVTRQGADGGLPAPVLRAAAAAWGEERTAHLVFAATAINAWNRIGVASGLEPELVAAA